MTPNLMTMMIAGGGAIGAGLGASGAGIGAGGINGSSSLGATFGGANASIGASASVNFSSALLQQLVNPQGQTVTPAQLETFRAELPADVRGQLDTLLNQLAIQGGVATENGAPSNVPAIPQAQVNAQDVASDNVTAASLAPVAQESVLALLNDAINEQPATPRTFDESEEETLLGRLLARTAPDSERSPASLFRTVDVDALPADDAQSLWLSGVNQAATSQSDAAQTEAVIAQNAQFASAAQQQQPLAVASDANDAAFVAPISATLAQEVQSTQKQQPVPLLQPNVAAANVASASDINLTQSQLSEAAFYQLGGAQNVDAHSAISARGEVGVEEAALLRGNPTAEVLPQPVNTQPVATQTVASGFESLTFINELGAEQIQRPTQSENINHFSAEFTRTLGQPNPTEQVVMQIRQQAHIGMQKIQLQLEPADLGRVEVQLEIASDGKVNAMVQAENQDTLDLLQRDSKALQDALASAGMEMSDENMQFSLNQQGGDAYDSETSEHMASDLHSEEQEMATPEELIAHYSVNLQQGLDIRV